MRKLDNTTRDSKTNNLKNKQESSSLKEKRLKDFKEKYSSLLKEKKQVKETTKKEEVKEITEKQVKDYNFVFKTAKNIYRVLKPEFINLLLFLILDLYCLSKVDFEDTTEEEQKQQYTSSYKVFMKQLLDVTKLEELTNEDIINLFLS